VKEITTTTISKLPRENEICSKQRLSHSLAKSY
jgi:hypothetical protein